MSANRPTVIVRRILLVAAIVFLSSAAVQDPGADASSSQPLATTPDGWEIPRTADGHPDLQGNWTNATLTPLQRPRGREPVLTEAEVVDIEQGQAELVERLEAPSDPDRPLPVGGNNPVCIDGPTSCYNEAYREPGDRVARVHGEPRSSLLTSPSDGRVPALTPAARAWQVASRARTAGLGPYDHPEVRPLGERCLLSFGSNAGPPMLPNYWYNNNYTIVQTQDHILILSEMVHDARIIRMGERSPLPDHIRPWLGDSWGRWVGDTLVVETTNIHPLQNYPTEPIGQLVAPGIWGVRPTAALKVTERFTRVDEQTILYEFTVDDPTTYTQTWGGEVPFKKYNDLLYEYSCHEGNYAMSNILSGARYQERQAGGN